MGLPFQLPQSCPCGDTRDGVRPATPVLCCDPCYPPVHAQYGFHLSHSPRGRPSQVPLGLRCEPLRACSPAQQNCQIAYTIQSIAYLCLWRILMRHGPLQPPHVSCFCKSSEKSSIIVINTWHRKAGCLDNLLACVELQTGSSVERRYCQLHHVAKNQNLFAAIHGARRCNIQPSLRVDIYISYQKDQVMFNFCN